ncbi:MAG: hypothetical protein FJ302_10560 [Planctomycetes bacterium]|nr:hypothetical protein [Planctomycetota bacterium]
MSLKQRALSLIVVSVLAGVVGCGGSELPKPVSVTPAAPPALKAMLENVVETGEVGSGAEQIRAELEKLKQTDDAKGTALLTDLDKLEKLSDPDAVKTAAKAMVGKL